MDNDNVFQWMTHICLGGVNQHCFIWRNIITDLFSLQTLHLLYLQQKFSVSNNLMISLWMEITLNKN